MVSHFTRKENNMQARSKEELEVLLFVETTKLEGIAKLVRFYQYQLDHWDELSEPNVTVSDIADIAHGYLDDIIACPMTETIVDDMTHIAQEACAAITLAKDRAVDTNVRS